MTSKLPSNMVRRVCVSVPRYWAQAATVTVISHCSHTFITDINTPKGLEGVNRAHEHTAQGEGLLRYGADG